MQRTPIYSYYVFGYNYRLIGERGLLGRNRKEALAMVDEFFQYLEHLDLQVTRVVAAPLYQFRLDTMATGEAVVTEAESERIKLEFSRIDPALDAELSLKNAYVLTKKRYPLDTLLDSPESLLAVGTAATLTPSSLIDFKSGCRQVALSQATAAAFHLMRMLEEQVKVLYFAFKKTKHLPVLMWGPMTQQLKAKTGRKPSAKLLSHLDGMREHFRNPTQHPELFYTLDQAQDLLSQTMVAVNMIAVELPAKKS